MRTDLLIIGGGLAGLAVALGVATEGREFRLIEARRRLGGRIRSVAASEGGAKFDLGPAWFWPGQARMARLVRTLGLTAFAQDVSGRGLWQEANGAVHRAPPASAAPPAFRVAGGMEAITDGLAARLPAERLGLGVRATGIRRVGGAGWRVEAATEDGAARVFEARRVVVALPPRLAVETIAFDATVPEAVLGELRSIPTWMAGHAKILAAYERPFWREAGLSGAAFSLRGPLAEIHDASTADGSAGALFGFVGVSAEDRRSVGEAALQEAARKQLAALFGPQAATPRALWLANWSEERFTAASADRAPLRAHPSYGRPPALRALDVKGLVFAATELASGSGGLLEGALAAAEEATQRLGSPTARRKPRESQREPPP